MRPDVGLAGGLTHCKKIAAIAESYHSAVVTHNFLGPVDYRRVPPPDASIPNFLTQEYSKNDEADHNRVYELAYRRDGGYIPFPRLRVWASSWSMSLSSSRRWAPLNTGVAPLRADGSIAYSV